MSLRFLVLVVFLGVGCASSTEVDPRSLMDLPPDVPPPDMPPRDVPPNMPPVFDVSGRVVQDVDGSDRTRRRLNFNDEVDIPQSMIPVTLLGQGTSRTAMTDAQGFFGWGDVAPGEYVIDVTSVDFAATHNAPNRVPVAIAEGSLRITTFGDSLPVVGGGGDLFPAIVRSFFERVAPTENVNLAIEGTTVSDWRVGGSLFEDRLGPEIEATDLFIVSLGGNDFLNYIQELFFAGGMDAVLEALNGGAVEEAERIARAMLEVVGEVRRRNSQADIAYLIYPNYALSEQWRAFITSALPPDFRDIAVSLVESTLAEVIGRILFILDDEDLLLVDLYGLTSTEPIDPLLIDELHFTDRGHERVAEELFLTCGGVRFDSDVLNPPYEIALR
ncbi:MAG: GDSL-type esterase/lipase family protein [Myxococcota bacterium]